MPESLSFEEQAFLHLKAVLPQPLQELEAIEIRCLDARKTPARPGPRFFVESVEGAIASGLQNRERWDVFFGVGPRRCPWDKPMGACPHAEKGFDHVSRLGVCWGDFDVKDTGFESQEEVVAMLDGLDYRPTCLVSSGKGIHAYWRFDEANTDLKRVETLNKALRSRFRADNAVDATRILRLAGTLNHKYGTALPVTLLRCGDVPA